VGHGRLRSFPENHGNPNTRSGCHQLRCSWPCASSSACVALPTLSNGCLLLLLRALSVLAVVSFVVAGCPP
jgi:hypothetical protein